MLANRLHKGFVMAKVRSLLTFSRRQLLMSFLTLAAFLRLRRADKSAVMSEGDDTVIAGRWLLKKSDLS